ncbi:efflux transporter outer membrane subunit [Legionella maioricensis]|uniref:Efflux transporter outer membrane subunit n=1 Tax=Legionella maioricensis TaxID=2896528 RepID=A0A9X2CXQ5_9GAMM|nr:efflux transporter outer membrane subunit [Legionella maioricensis]MCL9682676.1 efflux transporter outer membrane subunit [Legionella maioricensis]MCL9687277.1 efflux transporter outer membrane subunit [Legionella maioricensis]
MDTKAQEIKISLKSKLTLTVTLVSLLSSCMVGPNYKRPPVLVSPKFKEVKGQPQIKQLPGPDDKNWKPIHPQDYCDRGEWWKIFNDPLLNDLEKQLNEFNQNIVNAEANYRRSLAIVEQARSNLFPSLEGAFSLFRQKQGGGTTTFISTSGGTTTTGTASSSATGSSAVTTTTYSSVLTASWEPDIWGAVRRTIEADVAVAQSNAAFVAFTRLSAQGSLAQIYFELRTLDTDQKLLDDTVNAYKKTLQLTRNQYASGVASRADIVQAQAQLESAQAQAINNGILRGQYEHAIAVLMGRPPAFLSLKFMPLATKLPEIPVEVPSVWLERRPDVAQAERLVQQTSALIGVAVAAYFPTLTLTGSASAAANSFHKLIHTPSIGWSAGLQAAETLFDAGFRAATVRSAKAAYYAQIAAYRQSVLTAFQDVEDNLIALRLLREQLIVQNKAAASANLALKLVINQYKAGTVDYASVVTSQINAYTAQKAANDVAGLLMSTEVGLIKALGGGWDAKSLCCVAKDHS